MKRGICKMCLKLKDLVLSHLMPRALYDLCRTKDSEPVRATSEVIMQTSRQTKDHLLCKNCEDILNKEGENWLLPKLAVFQGAFPLFDILKKFPPDIVDGDFCGYAAFRNPEINVKSIIHFGAGIFWKASVHSWRGGTKEPLIELGPYSEKLRQFLVGDGAFPEHVVLTVGLPPPSAALNTFVDPFELQPAGHKQYMFHIPGMHFSIAVGKAIRHELREMCFAKSPLHLIVVLDISDDIKKLYQQSTKRAYSSDKIKALFKARKKE